MDPYLKFLKFYRKTQMLDNVMNWNGTRLADADGNLLTNNVQTYR